MKSKRVITVLILTIILIIAMSSVAFAVPNPGAKMKVWFLSNIQDVFIIGVAIIGITLLVTRSLMKALVALVFVAIGAAFIYGGDGLGQSLGKLINSWF